MNFGLFLQICDINTKIYIENLEKDNKTVIIKKNYSNLVYDYYNKFFIINLLALNKNEIYVKIKKYKNEKKI